MQLNHRRDRRAPSPAKLRRSPHSAHILALWTLCLGAVFYLSACNLIESDTPPTLTPTRALSGPTLEPSPTVNIQSVDQLNSDSVVGQNDLTAASVPSGGALPPLPLGTQAPDSLAQTVQITAGDGAQLLGSLYQSGGERLPGVLLLAKDTTSWGDFPARLQDAGFTVLAMPLRQPPTTADFHAIMQAFSVVGAVNPGRIGVVGAEEGADLALIGCAAELLCDTVVLLTPLGGDTLLNIIAGYNPRPLLVSASETDPDSLRTAQALQQVATGEVMLQPFADAGRGAAMLQARPDLSDLIIAWLQRQLMD